MDKRVLIVGGVVLALGVVGYLAARRLGRAIDAGAFNPVSANNLVYQGVSAVTGAVSGIKGDTLGFALHRLVNPGYEAWDPNLPGTPADQARARSRAGTLAPEWLRVAEQSSFGLGA